VTGVVTGEKADAYDVKRLLPDVGRLLNDLRLGRRALQHCMALKTMASSLSKLEEERLAINEQIAMADRARDAADPLFERRRHIDAATSEARRASLKFAETGRPAAKACEGRRCQSPRAARATDAAGIARRVAVNRRGPHSLRRLAGRACASDSGL
jgi:hypothetical protein